MSIVEEPSDRLGRWFAEYDSEGVEVFSARLLFEGAELSVAWTADLRQVVPLIAEIQRFVGFDIRRIVGTASDGLEVAVLTGRFRAGLYARRLGRLLGGSWHVAAVKRSGVRNEVWDIIAERAESL